MFNKVHTKPFGIMLVSVSALSLAACGSSGSYRVASVGTTAVGTTPTDTGGGGTTGGGSGTGAGSGTGSGSGSGTGATGGTGSMGGTGSGTGTGGLTTAGIPVVGAVLVTAGNTVIGLSSKHNALATKINGLAPGATTITGTVTNVLAKTGQSLVDLGQGQSLILNGAGGKLGEVVKIDLLSKTVTGASSGSGLLGVSVLSPVVATGSVAAVNLGNSGALVSLGGAANTGGVLAPVTTVVNGVTGGTTGGALAPVTTVVNGVTGGTTGSVLAPVTNVVGGVTGGLTGNVTGSVTGGATATGGVTTAGVLAPVTNIVGGLTGKVSGLTGH